MPSVPIHVADLYGRSVWLHFLYERLGRALTVPGACVLWALVQAGLFGGLCATQGTLLPGADRGQLHLLEDATFLAYFFLVPFCFALLYFSLVLFRRYLMRLDEVLEPSNVGSSAIETAASAQDELILMARSAFTAEAMRRARRVFAGLGLLVFLYNALINLDPGRFYGSPLKWDGIHYPLSYALARAYMLLLWGYLLPSWAAEVFVQLRVMARLSQVMVERRWLRIVPYAPDGFGGLGRLAFSASWVGYLILTGSLFFLAPLLRHALLDLPLHVGNFIGLGVYVFFAFIGIFTSVFVLHRCLAQKRLEMLTFLAGAFQRINQRVDRLVQANDVQGLADENLGRALETIDRLYQQWSALPGWPVSFAMILKFVATVVVPAIGYVIVQQSFARLAY